MNRSIIRTEGDDKVNSNLTVPSGSSDIRLVAETSGKRGAKRGGFRKMAKDSKTNARPARTQRRIKLNRNIFNTDSTAKPSFRVKTLSEIKSEKEAAKPAIPSTEVENSLVENGSSSVDVSSARPMPARSVNATMSSTISADTRNVVKRENTTPLLLPNITIQLRRIEHCSRSFYTKQNKSLQNSRMVVNKETGAGLTLPKEVPKHAVLSPSTQGPSTQPGSPVKKRKVDSVHLTISNPQVNYPSASPFKRRKMSPIRSPNSQLTPVVNEGPALSSPSPLQPPSPPLESPPSPTLSLGAQSDDEFTETPVGNSRVIIMTEPKNIEKQTTLNQYKTAKPVQTNTQRNIHTRLGPPPNTQRKHIPRKNAPQHNIVDDTLDVMSFIADDDELFVEDNTLNGPLKRSLSQDSIFSMAGESNNRGNLRSLGKTTQATPRHLVGDLITSKPISKSFKIPRQNSGRDTSNRNRGSRNSAESDGFSKHTTVENSESYISGRRGSVPRNGFFGGHLSRPPPKPARVVSNDGRPLNGFSIEQKVRSIQRNLGCKNICEAWSIIKELDDMKSDFDVRVLEEMLKVCEQVSLKGATPGLAEIVLSVFGILGRQGALKPMAYILTVLILSRCGKFEQAFDKVKDMIKARSFAHQEVLVHFVHDLSKCLKANPKWIIELLQYIKSFNFSNPTQVFNDCLSFLVAAPIEALGEITASQWDALIAMVCVPPNTHAAMQVQNIMDKHCIPMSDQAITKLLILFRDSKCTKHLLDFAHKKCTNQTFDIGPIFGDENLNLRDVEAHIGDLVKDGVLPRDDVVHHFIDKALSQKEFTMIYDIFLNSSSVKLSITTLKKMVDALENWDENINASVEVYTVLRQAKMAAKKDTPPLFQKPLPAKSQHGCCFSFLNYGWCGFGDRCWFSHAVDEHPHPSRQNIETPGPRSVAESDIADTQADIPTASASIPLVNGIGHHAQRFPSFQRPSFVVPLFNPINQRPPLRVPQAKPARHPFAIRFQAKSVTSIPRFGHPPSINQPPSSINQPPLPINKPPPPFSMAPIPFTLPPPRISNPPPLMFRPLSAPTTPNTDKVKLNRSFSWEPGNNPPPKLRQSPLLQFQQPSPGSDNNNNGKGVSKLQQRVERGVASKDWPAVYLCYVEMKTENDKTVQASDLKIFRRVFVKDISAVGSNFCEFVDFVHKEKSSVKSSFSDSANPDVFDKYDVEFLGSLGVSLMEKCLVIKKYDQGYEILHSLHAHNVSYFNCGKNFGAYIKDIPPSAVAIIAMKLCMGMSQEDSLLGAVEVLRASNYAIPEDDTSPDSIEYRIKVLQQVFTQLLDQGNISEAYEILQHLNASHNILVPLYVKVLHHYSSVEDFDQSFDVLAEMREKDFDLNIPASQSLYEKFLKLCLRNEQDEEAITALKEMESRGVTLNGDVWQEILNHDLAGTNEILTKKLFRRCASLGVYPESFSTQTPWLCQIGCGYSRLEVKLLIVRHLKQLHQHLMLNAHSSITISNIRDFQITLFPRVSESNMNVRFDDGIETAINKNGLVVTKVLVEDLNPPLTISDQTQEQFHSRFIVDAISLYRWFNANDNEEEDGDDDDASSKASVETCMSFMTRMTEFD